MNVNSASALGPEQGYVSKTDFYTPSKKVTTQHLQKCQNLLLKVLHTPKKKGNEALDTIFLIKGETSSAPKGPSPQKTDLTKKITEKFCRQKTNIFHTPQSPQKESLVNNLKIWEQENFTFHRFRRYSEWTFLIHKWGSKGTFSQEDKHPVWVNLPGAGKK